ncbi:MAG TPA: MMPL family transporter, partial [Thermomicrobiales bacterium]|nr:MMPL family transporter [Thermomicrobiales bacterium]
MSSASLLYRWGFWAATHKWRVIGAWLIGFAILASAAIAFHGEFSDAFSNPGSDSQQAYDLLAERFPAQSGDTAQIVFQANKGITDVAVQAEIQTLLDTVATLPHVASIDSPLTNPANVSSDGTIAYATVQYNLPAQDIPKAD